MESKQYNIFFEGKIIDGVDPAQARSNVQRLLKIDAKTAEGLFSGKRRALKKAASADVARKYRAALRKAGVECIIEEVDTGSGLSLEPKAAAAREAAVPAPSEDSENVNPYAPPQQDAAISQKAFCRSCGAQIDASARSCPSCGAKQLVGKPKNKVVAALLAIFLGWLGIHRFYLGQWVGIVYLIFGFIIWPITWIEGIVFLCTSRERWEKKYGNVVGGGGAMLIVAALLIVMIIGILAAIAIPQYHEYVQRAKIAQSIIAVQPALDKVAEFGKSRNRFPASNAEAGLVDNLSAGSIGSFRLAEDGVGTLTFTTESQLIDGKTVLFIPTLDGSTVSWDCSGGTLDNRLRPLHCRDGKHTGREVAVTRQWVVADNSSSKIRVPKHWQPFDLLGEESQIEMGSPQQDQFLIVVSESKADFSRDTDVFVYNDLVQQNYYAALQNLQLKYRGEVEINGLRGLMYELRGEANNINIVYLQVALESEHRFHQVVFKTTPSLFDVNVGKYEEILASFTECPGVCAANN